MELRMLCAGAAQGLVLVLQEEFVTRTGVRVGAVRRGRTPGKCSMRASRAMSSS
jgi:hypothetical protein